MGRSYDCYARKSSRSNKYTVYDLHRFRDRVRTVLVDPAKKDNNITDALRKKVEQMLQLFCANNLLFFPELWKCKSMKEAYAKLT